MSLQGQLTLTLSSSPWNVGLRIHSIIIELFLTFLTFLLSSSKLALTHSISLTKAFYNNSPLLKRTQLRGSALTWLCSENEAGRHLAILSAPNPWEAFSNVLRRAYEPVDAQRTARDRLWSLRHLHSVQAYVDQMRRAFIEIGRDTITDDERLDRFLHGLKPAVAAHVRCWS